MAGRLQEAASDLAVEATWTTLNDACRFDAGENVGGRPLKLARLSGLTFGTTLGLAFGPAIKRKFVGSYAVKPSGRHGA